MRWEGNEQSDNVEDRRDGGGGGGGGGLFGGRSIGIGTIAVALIAGWVFGINPLTVLGLLSGGGDPVQVQQQQGPAPKPPTGDREAAFVSTVLKNTEVVWTDLFRKNGGNYQAPRLVLFRGATPTACGTGQSAMGPFYCPGDSKVYIDLAFFDELQNKFKAPGDFAQAYVIAHEVGHHVQHLLGISDQVDQLRRRNPAQANALSVRVELQADCFAGLWAQRADAARNILEGGDVEEALAAATAIGDDRLQKQAQGYAVPDSFTHGSSAQRVRWFKRGLESGNIKQCDTFSASAL